MENEYTKTVVIADEKIPAIHTIRDFKISKKDLYEAHTNPEIYAKWIGPNGTKIEIDYWVSGTGGKYRYVNKIDGVDYGFYGSFHLVTEDLIIQTFTFEGFPEEVTLDKMKLEELSNGYTRVSVQSTYTNFEARDGMLQTDMEIGLEDSYKKLEAIYS